MFDYFPIMVILLNQMCFPVKLCSLFSSGMENSADQKSSIQLGHWVWVHKLI